MNLPVWAVSGIMLKRHAGYPQTCGKIAGFFHDFNMVIHIQKAIIFWLFGTYPLFPPLYGSYC